MESLKEVGRFLYRHKNKLAIAAVVAIGTAIYYNYTSNSNSINDINEEDEEDVDEYQYDGNHRRQRAVRNIASRNSVQDSGLRSGMRSKYMLRIRKQFDSYARQFLPTLRIKIKEVVDVSSAIRKIKELRNSPEGHGQEEIMLWEEIKVHSFTMLFVTSYMISAMVVLLRIQLHILARQLRQLNSESNRNGPNVLSTPLPSSATMHYDELNALDNNFSAEMFTQLIEGTYQQLFNTGLTSLAKLVKQRIENLLSDWTISKKLKVEYEELLETMLKVRRSLEEDNITELISMIMIPENSHNNTNAYNKVSTNNDSAQQLISQTWDVVESPMFVTVFSEATEICFRRIFENLKRNIFADTSDYTSSGNSLRSPPLASVLPQLKAICSRLLPDDAICPDVKEIYSGPSLDALCVSIFDAVDTKLN